MKKKKKLCLQALRDIVPVGVDVHAVMHGFCYGTVFAMTHPEEASDWLALFSKEISEGEQPEITMYIYEGANDVATACHDLGISGGPEVS